MRNAGAAAGAALIGIGLPQFLTACRKADQASTSGAPLTTLDAVEAVEIEAVAACIFPTTDTPGAREAGAIHFIDYVLGHSRADLLQPIRDGMADLQLRAQAAAASAGRFSGLDPEKQVSVLIEVEKTGFFEQLRLLTLAGMFADPSYGGNRDRIGWQLIGFDGHFGAQPPFGWYDAHPQGEGT